MLKCLQIVERYKLVSYRYNGPYQAFEPYSVNSSVTTLWNVITIMIVTSHRSVPVVVYTNESSVPINQITIGNSRLLENFVTISISKF